MADHVEPPRRNLWRIVAGGLIYSALLGTATGMPFSVLVLFLQDRGFGLSTVALLLVATQITNAIFEIPTGVLSDRFSHKGTLTASATCFILACTGLYFAQRPGIAVSAMVFLGLTLALESGTIQAYLHDSLHQHGRAATFHQVVAAYMATKWYAMLAAALLTSVVARAAGLRAIVIVAAGFALLAATAGMLLREPAFLRDVRGRHVSAREELARSLRHAAGSVRLILQSPVLRTVLLLRVAVLQAVSFATTFLVQPYLHLFGWPAHRVAIAAGGLQAVLAVTATLSSRILKRFRGETRAIVAISTLCVGALALYAVAPSAVVLLAAAAILRVVNGLFQPFAARLISERVDSSQRASVFSINQLGHSASAIVIAPVFGRVADSYSVPTSAAAFFVLFTVLIAAAAATASGSLRGEPPTADSGAV